MKKIVSISVLLSFFLVVGAAVASGDDNRKYAGEDEIGRVRKKVGVFRAWRLTEELNLDEETSARLFPAMRRSDRKRQKVEADNRRIVRLLREELRKSAPDRKVIEKALDRLAENRQQTLDIENEHLQEVRDILSPEDTARYLLFQVKFQREIRQRIMHSGERMMGRDGEKGR